MKDVNEVGLILLKSVAKFKSKNIDSTVGSSAYLKGYRAAREIMEHCGSNYSVESMLFSLDSLKLKAKDGERRTFSDLITGRRHYYLMAINDAIDVIKSMDSRFVSFTKEFLFEDQSF